MFIKSLLIIFSFINFQPQDTTKSYIKNFNLTAAVDTYYAYDFNRPLNNNRQFTTQAARHNEFNINWAFIQLNYSDDLIRSNFAIHTGTYVLFNYADEPNTLLKLIAQANAGVKIGSNIWIDVGVLPSHIGYENTLSAENEIYTRALMAENSPYFSTGVQLNAEVTKELTASFVILNGWQNITETNHSKSVGMNINYKPAPHIEINYSNYWGNEGNKLTGRKMRFFNHSYLKYRFSSKLHGALSFDIGNQELLWSKIRRTWHTGMIILQHRFNEKLSVAGRVEYYHDPYQIMITTDTPNGFKTRSNTLNLNYHLNKYAIFRLEGRMYNATDKIFNEGISPQKNNYLLVSSITLNLK